MIGAAEIERAERILQIVYREKHVPAQLRNAEVDIESFNRLLEARVDVLQKHHMISYRRADQRIHQAYNTLLMHMFLVGLVCGRGETKEIT